MEEVVKRNENKVFRTAIAITGSKADAEDIMQEAFLKLMQAQKRFESTAHETAWLLRVTVNLAKNHLRSHWWKKTVPLLESYPAQPAEQQELMEQVLSLPAKYRTVIHLFYFEGYSTKEIAALTRCAESSVRAQLTRARRLLKSSLELEGGNYDEKV